MASETDGAKRRGVGAVTGHLYRRADGGFTYERPRGSDDYAELLAEFGGGFLGTGLVSSANEDVVRPRDNQRVPKGGAWAMVARQLPPLERNIDEHLVVGAAVWVTHEDNADDYGFLPDGTYRVLCASPWGDLKLWPYEYTVVPVERLLAYWQGGTHVFHPLRRDLAATNAVVFYARSRGIALAEAMAMALGTLSGPVGWFEPVPEVAAWMADLSERINRWPQLGPENHARRAAARHRSTNANARGGRRWDRPPKHTRQRSRTRRPTS